MQHLRVVSPSGTTADVVDLLRSDPATTNVVVLPDCAVDPPGDVVMADVAREGLSPVLDRLTDMGLHRDGSVAVETVDTSLSHHATRAEAVTPGLSEDALVWPEVVDRTESESRASLGYLALMALATTIGMIGVLFDQPILIVGAMVTGPDFGPLAAISVALVGRRWRTVGRAVATLGAGFAAGFVASVGMALLLQAWGLADQSTLLADRPQTSFIWAPDALSWVVGALAGAAGMISLTTGRAGVLVGVLISVTTVPAVGNAAVALAYGVGEEATGSLAQFAINVAMIVAGAVVCLVIQRTWWHLRPRWQVERPVTATGSAGRPARGPADG
ncbi:DUF389 domain-containing protein [Promicromonospora sp. NPDC050880]|uniref:DUF389 domain-containing protein n=1 Tax=unclassified Promicromonospora TaxID=2647929 RepID=UPI00379EA9CB